MAGGAGGWQCWQQGPGHPGSRVSQRDPPGAPAAAGGRRDAWSSVPLGPVSMGLSARSGGMAAASPSSATAQPGCPAVQGIPPFHPFLPDVLMEAPRPPAKGWVALLRLPCRQNPGMLPQPKPATGASAQPGCTCCLPGTTGRGSFAKNWGHTRIYLSCTSQREGDGGLAFNGTHGSLPLLPLCSICGWFE